MHNEAPNRAIAMISLSGEAVQEPEGGSVPVGNELGSLEDGGVAVGDELGPLESVGVGSIGGKFG